MRGFVDPNEPAKGLRMNVEPGQSWRVPTMVSLDRTGTGAGR